ncbi:antiviral reverse transcriptase Drt5 [Bacillus sp. GB_SG_008]|uniref:antiviral reverse transcriptase Drt5 n=1 Tax=Bacillus sp. GB_SG_008 TaxID=3454627 RepID=UPI003F84F74C
MSEINQLYDFMDKDHFRTLFPLSSIRVFSKYGLERLLKFINEDIFSSSWLKLMLTEDEYKKVQQIIKKETIKKIEQKSQNFFLVQPLVYASKDKNHVRQTFVLDPIAQTFLYDFVYRHKSFFERKGTTNRKSFGYCFEDGNLVSGIEEHNKFKKEIYEKKTEYVYMAKLDIANCFNNIYHHDMVSYIARIIGQEESEKFGRFLREINEGRSTSCMPQGLIPAKIVGSFFLSFVEESRELKSEVIIRFMDDIFLFSNSHDTIQNDVLKIQKLLGEKGLSLNESKSAILKTSEDEVLQIEDIKKSLLQTRASFIDWYSEEVGEDKPELTLEQENYLKQKLQNSRNLEEEDIELILTLLSTTQEENIELVKLVLEKAPNLTKNLYHSIRRNFMYLDNEIVNIFKGYIRNNEQLHEYQLFWIAKILIEFTQLNEFIVDILFTIYNHSSTTNVVKCLILEIQENSYGLLELKKKIARGNAPEMVISAIVGLISHEKSNRNQIYKYVSRSNPIMKVYTSILSNLDRDAVTELISNEKDKFVYLETIESNNPFIDVESFELPEELEDFFSKEETDPFDDLLF